MVVDHPERLPTAPVQLAVRADRDGTVTQVEPRALGRAIIELGGGRRQVTDAVLPDVGLEVPAKPGQTVRRGERLAVIHARSREAAEAVVVDCSRSNSRRRQRARRPSPACLACHQRRRHSLRRLLNGILHRLRPAGTAAALVARRRPPGADLRPDGRVRRGEQHRPSWRRRSGPCATIPTPSPPARRSMMMTRIGAPAAGIRRCRGCSSGARSET